VSSEASPELLQSWELAAEPRGEVTPTPRIETAEPRPEYRLRLRFVGGEVREMDLRPLLDRGVFSRLRDLDAFRRVRVIHNGSGVAWESGADLSRDTLYHESVYVSGGASSPFKMAAG